MNSRDITIIILLLIVLAVLYKLMQTSKLQTELATGMAKKMGVKIKKTQKEIQKEIDEEEELTEHEDVEEEETEEDPEEEEVSEDEDEEEEEEIEVHEEDAQGKRIGVGKAVMLKVSKPKKKLKGKMSDAIASLISERPLPLKDLMDKYEESFGEITQAEAWRALTAASKKGIVVKQLISSNPNRYIYATPEMVEDGELKEEYKNN